MLTLTDNAVDQLQQIVKKQQNDNLALRVYVTPGGCSGFSYGMVVVDPFSLQYLDGAQVDYVDALMGGGFTVQNPNATKSCSCGHSFDTANGGGAAKPCS